MSDVTIDLNVPVPMRDGTVLRAGVYRPTAGGPMPALLMRTPYSKRNVAADSLTLLAVSRGYIVVYQDVRGRFDSEGEWQPWVFDRTDGYDSVQWAAGYWFSGEWCRFQTARERWLADAFRKLRDRVRAHRDIPVFLNGSIIKFDWWAGSSPELLALNDLLGGDFAHESVLPLVARATPTVMQYMKAVSAYGGGASRLMALDEQREHALAATAFGGQFMAIDAVRPNGMVGRAAYERLAEVFAAMEPYESFLGGTPVADVAVYSSAAATVDFADNGVAIDEVGILKRPSPHSSAMDGAVRIMKEAHLPVGVITCADLDRLDEIPVIVLPNVLRMDPDEATAFRRYVARGGRLYASGYSSLVTTGGEHLEDFLLADVFGCRYRGEEDVAVSYLRPATPETHAMIAPVDYVLHGEPDVNQPDFGVARVDFRVEADRGSDVLATRTLPYRGGGGTRDDHGWASIRNSPPWEDTGRPAVVHNRYGSGEAVYVGSDIESVPRGASSAAPEFFLGIVRSLLGRAPRFEAEAHPDVWVTAFDEPQQGRTRLCLLASSSRHPSLPFPAVRLRVSAPPGASFVGLTRLPVGDDIPFELDADGDLTTVLRDLDAFEMIAAAYRPAPGQAD